VRRYGFNAKDALHVACAAQFECDFLLTTDKKLIWRAWRIGRMKALNSIIFVANYAEYIEDEK